jgi:hypothetical protein
MPVEIHTHTGSPRMNATRNAAKAGVGFGSALAITISWSLHQSIIWAIIHGFFGWLYVVYYAIVR